jgi:GNAT superfamily N-acetyltransferase
VTAPGAAVSPPGNDALHARHHPGSRSLAGRPRVREGWLVFASIDLARRIEQAEARLTAAIAGSVPSGVLRAVGGGVAALARPGSPLNKVIGLGFEPLDDGAIAEIESLWLERGEPVRVELSTLADPEIAARLAARGYQLQGFENMLALDLESHHHARSHAVHVSPIGHDDDAVWRTIAVDGFASPDGSGAGGDELLRPVLEQVMADFTRTSGLVRYVARIDGMPVGAASCRIDERLVQLCGATTLPAWRRRGVQRALLEQRLDDARAFGCTLAVITTAPGSQSQANAQRGGFALLYARAIMVRTWPTS